MSEPRSVGILLFEGVEALDFCGPLEVFSVAGRPQRQVFFDVWTVAETPGPILTRNGLSVNPSYTIPDCPIPDILVVPGGKGTRSEMHNDGLVSWIRERAEGAECVLSVCTGALLLAAAGMLDGLAVTTHAGALDLLRSIAPNATVEPSQRFVDNGKILLSAGIATGIDLSLHLVERLHGRDVAFATAAHMEYEWRSLPSPSRRSDS